VIGAVGSDEKAALARARGCDHPIASTREGFPKRVRELTGGKGVPVVYDSVGKRTFQGSLDRLPPGLMVNFGNASGAAPPFEPSLLTQKGSLYLTRPKDPQKGRQRGHASSPRPSHLAHQSLLAGSRGRHLRFASALASAKRTPWGLCRLYLQEDQAMKEDPTYLIDVPPPTISGRLHMGHVFSYCHMDFVARRMRAFRTRRALCDVEDQPAHEVGPPHRSDPLLYPFCFDCNGLPTEKLAQQEEVFDRAGVIRFAQKTSGMYSELFEKIGIGWSSHRYHTFDENAIALAEMSFHDLVEKGYAYKATRPYFWCPKHRVSVSQAEIDEEGCYERSGEKVEMRTGEGWFVNIRDHVPQLRGWIDRVEWRPDHFRERLHRWVDQISMDWSISRERNYGIRVPGEPDNIVFDTWFTSSLSPQMAWAAHTGEPSLRCPVFDVRFQAHDIIRTWAFFTIVKSAYHNRQIPWKRVIVSGHALDRHGRKISKTAGNFVSPLVYVERYGMEGVRYWAAQNQVGTDTRCDEAVMEKGKRLLNKLRNAWRFINGCGRWGGGGPGCPGGQDEGYYREWAEVAAGLRTWMDDEHNWPLVIQTLTDFFWHTYCDRWVEECKKRPIYDTLRKVFDEMSGWFESFFPDLTSRLSEETGQAP
jgi:valyl-tRNA synthetase